MKYIIVVNVTLCHLGIAIWRSKWLFTKERSWDKCNHCKCIFCIKREQMWDWNVGAKCFKRCCCSLWTLFQRELKHHMHENTKSMSEEDELQCNASGGWIGRNYCADIWTTWFLIVCLKSHQMFVLQNNMKTHIDFRRREKPSACVSCHSTFYVRSNMECHINTHTGGKSHTRKGRHKCKDNLMLTTWLLSLFFKKKVETSY